MTSSRIQLRHYSICFIRLETDHLIKTAEHDIHASCSNVIIASHHRRYWLGMYGTVYKSWLIEWLIDNQLNYKRSISYRRMTVSRGCLENNILVHCPLQEGWCLPFVRLTVHVSNNHAVPGIKLFQQCLGYIPVHRLTKICIKLSRKQHFSPLIAPSMFVVAKTFWPQWWRHYTCRFKFNLSASC